MQVNIVKLSDWRIPRQFIQGWLRELAKEIPKNTDHHIENKELTLAVVDKKAIRKLNRDFRSIDKATDILSFSGFTEDELGELVLCGEVLDQQAFEHDLSRNHELGYLLIHGVLHLLGYEHEKGGQPERLMFELQDHLFDVLRKKRYL